MKQNQNPNQNVENARETNTSEKPKTDIFGMLKKIGKFPKFLITGAVVIVVLAIILSVALGKPGGITTIAESSLKDVIEISEMSTLEYNYNSIVTVSNKDEEMYHVSYEGKVKAGFNFDDIKISTDTEKKTIYVDIPEIKINSVSVDDSSLDFIFIKSKYDTETTLAEAYKLCVKDLEKKAKKNEKLLNMARENAISSVTAMMKPWESQLAEGYKIECR